MLNWEKRAARARRPPMSDTSHEKDVLCRRRSGLLLAIAVSVLFPSYLLGQTPSTGALIGFVLDPSGANVPGVVIRLTSQETGNAVYATSDGQGSFGFLFL